MRPLIGITPAMGDEDYPMTSIGGYYTAAIEAAGGIPIVLPPTADPDVLADLCDSIDGVLFSGGDDINPKYYGAEKEPDCGEITENRDKCELALYPIALEKQLPIFGICRGIQTINVAAGGTLYQHIPGHSGGVHHPIDVADNSLLARITGAQELDVNSYHHQMVRITAPGCVVSGITGDGKIEAIERPDYPFWLGVQWHPERLTDDPHAKALFQAFVDASAEHRNRKTRE